jgi:hypothetical protein
VVTRTNRAASFVLASLFAAVQLAALAHHATSRHVRCHEHGELIHVDRARFDPRVLVADSGGVTPSSARVDSGHGHCALAVFGREQATVAPASGEVDAAARGVAVSAPGRTRLGQPRAIYRLAPKTSPPA